MDTFLKDMEPMRIATYPVSFAFNEYPKVVQTNLAAEKFSQNNVHMIMNSDVIQFKKSCISQIDELCVGYLAMVQDDSTYNAIAQLAASYKRHVADIDSQELFDSICNEFKQKCESILINSRVQLVNESINTLSQNALIDMVSSMYRIQLSNDQVVELYKALKEFDKSGKLSKNSAIYLLSVLDNQHPSDSQIAVITDIVETAATSPDLYYANESCIAYQLKYMQTILDESYGPSNLQNVIKAFAASSTAKSKHSQQIINEISELITRQTTSSALVANQYIAQLKQSFNDWQLAMQYGAKYGTPYTKANIQAQLTANQQKTQTSIDNLIALLHEVAKAFSCAPSIVSTKNGLGNDILKVKLISNWGQADDYTYNAIVHVLSSLYWVVTLSNLNGVSTIIIQIAAHTIEQCKSIAAKDSIDTECLTAISNRLKMFNPDGKSIVDIYETAVVAQCLYWWQQLSIVDKLINDWTAVLTAYWNVLNKFDRRRILVMVNAVELTSTNVDDLVELPYNSLFEDTRIALQSFGMD